MSDLEWMPRPEELQRFWERWQKDGDKALDQLLEIVRLRSTLDTISTVRARQMTGGYDYKEHYDSIAADLRLREQSLRLSEAAKHCKCPTISECSKRGCPHCRADIAAGANPEARTCTRPGSPPCEAGGAP